MLKDQPNIQPALLWYSDNWRGAESPPTGLAGWLDGWLARRLAGIRTLTGWLTHHCANCNIQLHTTVQIALQYSINSWAMTEQWILVWHPGESLICVGMSRRRHRGTNLLSTSFVSLEVSGSTFYQINAIFCLKLSTVGILSGSVKARNTKYSFLQQWDKEPQMKPCPDYWFVLLTSPIWSRRMYCVEKVHASGGGCTSPWLRASWELRSSSTPPMISPHL